MKAISFVLKNNEPEEPDWWEGKLYKQLPQKIVVARGTEDTVTILAYEGADVEFEMCECHNTDLLEEFAAGAFVDPPDDVCAIWVWEGTMKMVPMGDWEHPNDCWPEWNGQYRKATVADLLEFNLIDA